MAANDETLRVMLDPNTPSPGQTNPEVFETLTQNANILATDIKPALADDGRVLKHYEGENAFACAMILYVNSQSGRIQGIGSHEKIARFKGRLTAYAEQYAEQGDIESEATGLPVSILKDPNIVRVNAWYEIAGPSLVEEGKIEKPASWRNNDRVRLSGNSLKQTPLEGLIPEAIGRGVFLKSIEDFNQRAKVA